MKKILIFGSLLMASVSFGQANIADARSFSLGQTVTVSGVVTNGSELGVIRYLQDGTAGIAAYGGSVGSINRYDSITVTGTLIEFSGLLEIDAPTYINHGPAVVQPQAINLPVTAANESVEAQYVVINNVNFVQTGNFASGNSTAQVTNGTNTLDIRINGSTNIDGTAIPTGTVSVYGLVGQFNTNYQIIPRNLADIVPYVAPDKEINVIIGGSTILTGSNYFIGDDAAVSVTIENLGVNNMAITGATFSGADAADFSSDINAGTIAGGASQTYTVSFNPTTNGSKFASISIGNDDPDENPYIINFEGAGIDGLATQPTANPSNIVFAENKAYKLTANFTAGTGATKYLVVWSNGSAPTGVPVDGTTYLRGDVLGNGKIAYSGSATGFAPRGIIANQNYHFAVYAFNGQGGFENYLTTAPATANVISEGEEIGNYYNGVSVTSPTFIADLTATVNPHTFISYFNYKQTMMAQFEEKDTTNGQTFVTCAYSGERKVFSGSFDWTAQNFSREHTFAHSWMPTYPADSPEKPEYTDQHNLQPTNFTQVNAVRSNFPLGEVVTVQSSYLGSKLGLDANGNRVFEPTDDMKGNIARSLMYMAVCYNGQSGLWAFPNQISFVIPYGQDAEIIRQWHFQDLPDNYEIARNEYVYSVQNNRNPFVDSVDFACHINFANMSYIASCNVGIEENASLSNLMTVYPVPTTNELNVNVVDNEITAYSVVDIAGREILTQSSLSVSKLNLNVAHLTSGTYFIKVATANGLAQKQFVVR